MCRYCNFQKIGGEAVDPLYSQEITCDWYFEDDNDYCKHGAAYIVEYGYVEDHLCHEHMDLVKNEFRDALRRAGHTGSIRSPYKFLQIKEGDDKCEHFGSNYKRCGKPASFARFVEATQFFCPEHSRKAGYLAAEG